MASFASNVYRINAGNLAIATSATGAGSPTEEVGKFVAKAGTIAFSTSSATPKRVTGTDTLFETDTDFAAGKTLVYLNTVTNEWDLVGVIESVDSETQITLVANAANTASGVSCSPTGVLVNANEDYLIRFTPNFLLSGTVLQIPNISALKQPSTGWLNTDLISFAQFSNTGDLNTQDSSPSFVNTDILYQTEFATSATNSNNFFTNASAFPQYVWVRIYPNGSLNIELSESTSYKIIVRGVLPDVSLTANVSKELVDGYGWGDA
jgi:hypothetical protein